MTKRDKIGLAVLITLFVVFCVTLAVVLRDPAGDVRDPSESVFVRQRIINIEKSR
jgi:hypothetical protein